MLRSVSHVLFVCLHNAGGSQISQALFERAAGTRHSADSAGSVADPAGHVHPCSSMCPTRGVSRSTRCATRDEFARRVDALIAELDAR